MSYTNRALRRLPIALVLVAALAAGACHKKPSGQVVATVDGQEITRRDLMAELQAMGGKSTADLKTLQPQLVSNIVDRKLLVEEAGREKLDKNPDYLSVEQRTREMVLASMLVQSWTGRTKTPDAGAIQAYVAKNPLQFGGRKLLLVSEISADGSKVKDSALAPLHGTQGVLGYLNANKIPSSQRTSTIDTLSLPADLAAKLLSVPAGEPLAIRSGNAVVFTTVLQSKDAPVPASQTTKVAAELIKRETAAKSVSDQIKQLRAAADIQYLPGFAPPKPATPAAAN